MENKKLNLNDRVELRKKHPCGGTDWIILRVGMDIRIKCCTCGRVLLVPRAKFEKMVKRIHTCGGEEEEICR